MSTTAVSPPPPGHSWRPSANLLEQEALDDARALLNCRPVTADAPGLAALRRALALPTTRAAARVDVDRRAEYDWLRRNAATYRGRWVAIAGEDLVAEAATLAELRERLRSQPRRDRDPLLHRLD